MESKLYGVTVWFVATLFVVYAFCLNTAAAVFVDPIRISLHTGTVGVSIATGAFVLGFASMQIPAGFMLDKYNARIVVSAGIGILALGNVLTSVSTTLVAFTLSNLIQGSGASFAFIAAAVLISQWFSSRQFPVMFGLTQTLSCVLAGIIHYVFSLELTIHTWQYIYCELSIFGLVLFILALIFIKSPASYQRGQSLSLRQSLSIVFSSKQIWLCSIAAAASFGVLLAYASLWYMQVEHFYSIENLQAVIISGMIFIGIGIGTPILGWYSNLIKSRISVIHSSLVLGTMALMLGLYLPHFNINTLIIIKTISFMIGFFLSGSMLFYTVVSELSADNTRGVALSLLNTIVFLFNTAMLFIPYLFITAASTEFFTYLWILPFCVMFSILLVYYIKETYTKGSSI